ncbi:hypothetical protein SETIT_6G173600v2 [Setaria italica]|uniref:Uncharacterized protein n=1 Tax=Setaria italica TaxID=4555 RepID=A0A368RMG7_SETIT|nr:hypothetical protein SETIT_6G173600v2 [Setaria italica]
MVADWWTFLGEAPGVPKKGQRTLVILVTWELWNGRNARVFNRKEQAVRSLLAKIREEIRTWSFARARALRDFCPTLFVV